MNRDEALSFMRRAESIRDVPGGVVIQETVPGGIAVRDGQIWWGGIRHCEAPAGMPAGEYATYCDQRKYVYGMSDDISYYGPTWCLKID